MKKNKYLYHFFCLMSCHESESSREFTYNRSKRTVLNRYNVSSIKKRIRLMTGKLASRIQNVIYNVRTRGQFYVIQA